jgi:hypothetical protein
VNIKPNAAQAAWSEYSLDLQRALKRVVSERASS